MQSTASIQTSDPFKIKLFAPPPTYIAITFDQFIIKIIKDSVMKKILLMFQLPSSNSVDMVIFQNFWKKIFSEFIHCSVIDQTDKAPPSLGQLNTLH